MAVDLNALREKVKPHDEDLLKETEPPKPSTVGDVMVNFLKEVEKKNLSKSKAGRPQKNLGQELKTRQTIMLTSEQKQIIERRRGAGRLLSIDSSTFIREWLIRSGMFDTEKKPILENPLDNLNTSFK